jgi:streptogramin lyase
MPGSAAAAPKVDGAPFPVPVKGIEANSKIVEGQDGSIWVAVGNEANDVARITPAGAVTEYALESGGAGFEGASGIARDADGHLWVTGEGKVAELTPADPPTGVAVFDLAQSKGGAVGGASIVLGPDGNMWLASSEIVLKFPPNSPEPPENTRTLFPVPELNPHDIDVAGNQLAVADQKNRVITLDTEGVITKEYALDGFSQGLAGLPGGTIAYSESGADPQAVGLITPPNKLTPIPTPAPGGDPFGVTVGQDGAFWFVMGAFGSLISLEPGGTQLGTPVAGMPTDGLERQIATGPNGTLWVTITKPEAEAVARISGVEKAPVPDPQPKPGPKPQPTLVPPAPRPIEPDTVISGGSMTVKMRANRAKVSFRFSSPSTGASFECAVVKLAPRLVSAPVFAPCGSPKSYRLPPGRYRFEVRAVLGGVADRSPASTTVRVVRPHRHRHRHR